MSDIQHHIHLRLHMYRVGVAKDSNYLGQQTPFRLKGASETLKQMLNSSSLNSEAARNLLPSALVRISNNRNSLLLLCEPKVRRSSDEKTNSRGCTRERATCPPLKCLSGFVGLVF